MCGGQQCCGSSVKSSGTLVPCAWCGSVVASPSDYSPPPTRLALMPPRSVIDHTAPIALTAANGHRPSASGAGGEAPAAASLEAFLARTRRLPACERSRSYHTATPRAPTSSALAAALHALQGKLVVVNEPAAVVIPSRLTSAVRGLARRCRGDSPVASTRAER